MSNRRDNELRVLSAIINNNSLLPMVTSLVEEDDFLESKNKEIFRRVKKQYQESGYVNFLWVVDNLSGFDDIDQYGRGGWSESQVREYCQSIRAAKQKKDLETLGLSLVDQTRQLSSKVPDIISGTTRQIFRIGSESRKGFESTSDISEMIGDMEEDQRLYLNKELLGYGTGMPTLDRLTKGMQKKNLWIIGGYCLGKGTKVLMYSGEKKNVEDVGVGEYLCSVDSNSPRRVMGVTRGKDEMYKISGKYIEEFTVNSKHILPVMWMRKDLHEQGRIYKISAEEFFAKPEKERKGYRLMKYESVYKIDNKLDVLPYFLGLWLGDGVALKPEVVVHSSKKEIISYLRKMSEENEYKLHLHEDGRNKGVFNANLSKGRGGSLARRESSLKNSLRRIGVLGNKHIPEEYMKASVENRLQLLAGLIDTDGSVSGAEKTCFVFYQFNLALIAQVKELAESLGLNTSLKKKKQRSSKLVPNPPNDYIWRLTISGNVGIIPTKVKSKQIFKKECRTLSRFKIEKIGIGEYFGFELDGNHLFMVQNNIVQHNTSYGKSWICLNLCLKARACGAKVLYISLEMNRKRIAWRLASLKINLNEFSMMTGNLSEEERKRMNRYFDSLRASDQTMWVCDGVTTSDDIIYKIMEMKSRFNIDMVCIDYIQNILVKSKDEYEALTVLARDFQRLAVNEDLFMLVASQMNRASLTKGNPGMGFHGSSQIEKAADIAIIIEKPEEVDQKYNLILNTAKNRNGMTGGVRLYTDFARGVIEDKGIYAL